MSTCKRCGKESEMPFHTCIAKQTMNFTKTPPTTPGFFAWRYAPAKLVHLADVYGHPETNALVVVISGCTFDVKDKGGEWCRLVPAEEVARAFYEGMEAYASEEKDLWNSSRAKQVAEGKL